MVPKYQCSYSRITISDGIGDWNGEIVEEDDMIDFSIALHDELRSFIHPSHTMQRWRYMRCVPRRRVDALDVLEGAVHRFAMDCRKVFKQSHQRVGVVHARRVPTPKELNDDFLS